MVNAERPALLVGLIAEEPFPSGLGSSCPPRPDMRPVPRPFPCRSIPDLGQAHNVHLAGQPGIHQQGAREVVDPHAAPGSTVR